MPPLLQAELDPASRDQAELDPASREGASGVIPLTRLHNADPELLEAVAQIVHTDAFTLGEPVASFERDFAAYCEAPFAIGVSSGTEALALSLRALGLGAGDEVIVPANSFIATAEAVSAVGARPRLVDVDPDSHLLTADIVAAALRPAVRCVVAVHLYGATVDLDPLLTLTQEAGVHVLEDACQAHGARYKGRRVGTLGALGCFSFYPAKNLGGWGDGGAVITSDAALAERVQLLRSHGERPRYRHRLVGATARLDALQAAVLRRKLTRLDDWNDERRRLGAALREMLAPAIELPSLTCAEADHVYHLFVVRCQERDALREHLAARGVASAVHYPTPIHLTEAYAHLGQPPMSLPVCEEHASHICSLPLFPGMSEQELGRVGAAVLDFAKARPHNSR
ncbi:MAG TPA: DegT/DnrJ/EryC1/StrS family aminotransferase [Solirubrobacteraceae bacterium]|nr:DegT/DnrJ/EryC1/StrS family aminotransferase [Solirubrobacteraceae bacterium]